MLSLKKSFLSAFATSILSGALGAPLPLPSSCIYTGNSNDQKIAALECQIKLVYDKVFDDTNGYEQIRALLDLKANTSSLTSYALLTYVDGQLANKADISGPGSFATLGYVDGELAKKVDTSTLTSYATALSVADLKSDYDATVLDLEELRDDYEELNRQVSNEESGLGSKATAIDFDQLRDDHDALNALVTDGVNGLD